MANVAERVARHKYPRLGNQIQVSGSSTEGRDLVQRSLLYDYLILDGNLTRTFPESLAANGPLRTVNPNIVITAYFSAGDIAFFAGDSEPITKGFNAMLNPDWWMYDANGNPIILFQSGTFLSYVQNQSRMGLNGFLPTYLYQSILSSGLWDGIFYDRLDNQISKVPSYFPPLSTGPLSIDNVRGAIGTPTPDEDADAAWNKGLKRMLLLSHQYKPSGGVVVGNVGYNWLYDFDQIVGGESVDFSDLSNGFLFENFNYDTSPSFDRFSWWGRMRSYAHFMENCLTPRLCMIMANQEPPDHTPAEPGEWDFQGMRFALCSTLMFDGYFAYTNSSGTPYRSNWIFDEFFVNVVDLSSASIDYGDVFPSPRYKGYLGLPKATQPAAYNVDDTSELLGDVLLGSSPADAGTKIWRRDFDNGIVLVNPTDGDRSSVILGGTYRKIKGNADFDWSDPGFNDGSTGITTYTDLLARSGVVLLNDG